MEQRRGWVVRSVQVVSGPKARRRAVLTSRLRSSESGTSGDPAVVVLSRVECVLGGSGLEVTSRCTYG